MGLTFIPRPSEARWNHGHPCGIGLTEQDNRSLVERSLTDSVLEMYFLLASLSVRISRILSSPVSVSVMDSEVGLVALWGP